MEINIQNIKLDIIQWLATVEDVNVIQQINDLRNNETKNLQNTITDAEKRSIELGITDANNGNLKPNSEAKKVYEKWL